MLGPPRLGRSATIRKTADWQVRKTPRLTLLTPGNHFEHNSDQPVLGGSPPRKVSPATSAPNDTPTGGADELEVGCRRGPDRASAKACEGECTSTSGIPAVCSWGVVEQCARSEPEHRLQARPLISPYPTPFRAVGEPVSLARLTSVAAVGSLPARSRPLADSAQVSSASGKGYLLWLCSA